MAHVRGRWWLARLVAVPVAVFAVPAAFLVLTLSAAAQTQQPVLAPQPAIGPQGEPCEPACESTPPPTTDTTTTEPTTIETTQAPETTASTASTATTQPVVTTQPASTTSTTRPPAAPTGGGATGGGGAGPGAGIPLAAAPSPSPRATTTVPTSQATQAADEPDGGAGVGQPVVAPSGHMPSALTLGMTSGILVAFVVAVAVLIRERRALVRERDEDELVHWRDYH